MPEIIAGAFFVLNKNSSSDITRNISSVWKKVRFSLVLDEGSRPTKVWKMITGENSCLGVDRLT